MESRDYYTIAYAAARKAARWWKRHDRDVAYSVDDAIQDAMVRLWRQRDQAEASTCDSGLMYRMASRAIMDVRQYHRNRKLPDIARRNSVFINYEDFELFAAPDEPLTIDELDELEWLCRQFSERHTETLRLLFGLDRGGVERIKREVADLLGVTDGAISQQLRTMRKYYGGGDYE